MNILSQEEKLLLNKFSNILGIDEAGRGPWAGPVVMAGVLIPNNCTLFIEGINDSKKILIKKRLEIFNQIILNFKYKSVIVSNEEIDNIGIGNSVVKGMNEIISFFNSEINLIDGYFKKDSFPINSECIIKGDQKYYSIAAASIIAKVTRDKIMEDLDKIYPNYNFKKHKGYGTKEHIEMLKQFGVSKIHRKTYKPIMEFIQKNKN